jgi:hypothetical protein
MWSRLRLLILPRDTSSRQYLDYHFTLIMKALRSVETSEKYLPADRAKHHRRMEFSEVGFKQVQMFTSSELK